MMDGGGGPGGPPSPDPPPPTATPTMQRVKVYRLNKETGTWDDKGTGSVSVEFLPVSAAATG
jgi:hypothetical protein